MPNIFKITFKDGSEFLGGDSILNSKWNDIPNKNISCLEYFLDNNSSIILKDYDSYNHIIEATKAVYGPKGTDRSTRLHNIYLMGTKGNTVTSYRIALIGKNGSDKYRKGDITKRAIELGKEFRGQPTVGWRKGLK